MKFYDCAITPNPRRARIFLAEKGIEVERVEVDILQGENLAPAFLAMPWVWVTALALHLYASTTQTARPASVVLPRSLRTLPRLDTIPLTSSGTAPASTFTTSPRIEKSSATLLRYWRR